MTKATLEQVQALIREVPDFPRPGVLFRDITPLLADAEAFACAVDLLAEYVTQYQSETVVAIESRGFVLGSALALKTGLPLQLIRKQGKLPGRCVGISYQLEYGSDRVEIHADAIVPGRAHALVDDLIATGGTAAAAADLIELQRGEVACCVFLMELAYLHGRKRLGNRQIESLIRYSA